MKQASLTISFVFLLFLSTTTIACKEPLLEETYSITNFEEYDLIVVVTIDKAIHSEEGYSGLISFRATVIDCLKGDLKSGDLFAGIPKKEEARACCPVHLNEKETYLLLLTKRSKKYQLSRFSLPVNGKYKYFNNYLSQIKSGLKF